MYTFNIYDFYMQGGFFMHPILICSIISLAIFMERLWSLRRKNVISYPLLQNLERLLKDGKHSEAVSLCKADNSSMSRIFMTGIKNFSKKRERLKDVLEGIGSREAASLGKYIEGLATIANVSTLLGLLGTISGMIKIFAAISHDVTVNPAVLAGGISEILNATAFGLAVAIPTSIFYKFLTGKADALVAEMEEHTAYVLDMLKGSED